MTTHLAIIFITRCVLQMKNVLLCAFCELNIVVADGRDSSSREGGHADNGAQAVGLNIYTTRMSGLGK